MIERATQVPHGTAIQADLCIVGAGAAGISLAMAMSGTGLQIVLLEGGQLVADAKSQSLYEGDVADPALHSPPVHYRQRRWGGSTTIWGGRCVPFDRQDFERREAVPSSGWPITFDDLAKYYGSATTLCEAGAESYQAKQALGPTALPLFAKPLGGGLTSEGLERFSCPTDFGARYRERLIRQTGLRILVGANLTHIALRESANEVSQLEISALAGRKFFVQARAYVLAVGGLETPRLLLASRDVAAQGVGNNHDVVGRYYMCHLAGSVGQLDLAGETKLVRHGYERTPEGIYCRRRIALTTEKQRDVGAANLVARLHFPPVSDPTHGNSVLSGIYLTRRLLSYEYSRRVSETKALGWKNYAGHLLNVIHYPHDAVSFLAHWAVHHAIAPRRFPSVILKNRSNRFSLEVNAEQIPLPSSRITLSDSRDALGTQRLKVDWRYSADDISSVARSLQVISDGFRSSGLGIYQFKPEQLEEDLTSYGAYGGHHIGTTRMGADPATSVVNSDCRVHGLTNLYIAGSSVFPTSSQANPTLTLVALSLRLAEKLSLELNGRSHQAAMAIA